jgi:F0F1-type ATP synthase epsilon subunit
MASRASDQRLIDEARTRKAETEAKKNRKKAGHHKK